MTSNRPLNYTTKIPARQTIGECQELLGRAGASAVTVIYADRQVAGLGFRLDTPHGRRDFTLPVDVRAMHARLATARNDGLFASLHATRATLDGYTSREHAANVAWRVAKDWLEANLALIEAEMATLDQVMLPYLHVGDERTLWQAYREHEPALALSAGGAS